MPERRALLFDIAALSVVVLSELSGCKKAGEGEMPEIKFDLGKNIVETARMSGVPRFQARQVASTISYGIEAIASEIPAHFTRSGYEIVWQPIFAFSMYASDKNNSIVDTAVLQLDNKIKTHEAAQAFVEQTIAQFAKGKWQRYHDPVWDVLLTGRSSLLNESGQIASTLMTIDPAYKIPTKDWPTVTSNGAYWRWVGDEVYAELSVTQLGSEASAGDSRVLDYRLNLEFQLLAVMLKRDAENLAEKNKEGNAKGWNSTVKYEASKKEQAALNRRLEANAIKRGDSVVTKP